MDLESLRTTPAFWSRLGFPYDPVRPDSHGKPVVFFNSFEETAQYHREIYQAGIKLHSSILFSGWVGADRYDYELTDKTLESIFSCGEDLLYIPRIKLNVPLDWCRENPEGVCVYYNGPREADKIRALVGTEKQDILGYNSPDGYVVPTNLFQKTIPFRDDRPNVNGVISLQSYSSERWLRDAGEALRRLVEHIENGPYGKRVAAYHIAYGPCGETCVFGQWSYYGNASGTGYQTLCGDYGIDQRHAFFDWGLRKYASLSSLRQAWLQPDLTRGSIEVPPPEIREGAADKTDLLFRESPVNRKAIDYELFMEDVQIRALEHFGKIIKDSSAGKLVGVFFGYFVDCFRSAYSGHAAIGKLMKTKYVDFSASPKSYYRNGLGEAGGEQGVAQSVNLHKIWMDEIDNGTHLDPDRSRCTRPEESVYLMRREFAKNLMHNSGYWWMDLGGGWYHDPGLLEEIRKLTVLAGKLHGMGRKSLAEILLVTDDASLPYMRVNQALHYLLLRENMREAALVGAPLDCYRFEDLEDLNLENYKLVVFLNCFRINGRQRSFLKNNLRTKTKLWFYASGIWNGNECSLENTESLCGFRPVERDSAGEYPLFHFVPGKSEILARHEDGSPSVGQLGNDIYSGIPSLTARQFREIAERAGCFFYAPAGNVVFADSRFTAVFRGFSEEVFEITMPRRASWSDPLSGEIFPDTAKIPLEKGKSASRVLVEVSK